MENKYKNKTANLCKLNLYLDAFIALQQLVEQC